MAGYEYQVAEIGGAFRGPRVPELEDLLNAMAAEGWELAQVVTRHDSNRVWVIMRRDVARGQRRKSGNRPQSWP